MFNPNINEFINNYDLLKSSREMGKLYNVDHGTILNFANKISYKNEQQPLLSNEQIRFIIESYYKTTSEELAKKFDVSKSLISKIWVGNNLIGKSNRTYYMDFDYFEIINTRDKAYFLGVIASDGCVYSRKNHEKMLSFQFHIQEKNIIYDFLKFTKGNYIPLETINRISLQINSDKICNDLSKYNIVPRKTWIYCPCELLNDNLMFHFMRGYFDGDGSIYYTKNNKEKACEWTIAFCGNYQTMQFIKDFFANYEINFILKKDNRERYTEEFYNLRLKKKSEKLKFIDLIYNESDNIRLNRKYDKAMYLHNLLIQSNTF